MFSESGQWARWRFGEWQLCRACLLRRPPAQSGPKQSQGEAVVVSPKRTCSPPFAWLPLPTRSGHSTSVRRTSATRAEQSSISFGKITKRKIVQGRIVQLPQIPLLAKAKPLYYSSSASRFARRVRGELLVVVKNQLLKRTGFGGRTIFSDGHDRRHGHLNS